jgi:hypothetical protein
VQALGEGEESRQPGDDAGQRGGLVAVEVFGQAKKRPVYTNELNYSSRYDVVPHHRQTYGF